MTGEAHWFPIVSVLGGGLVLLLVGYLLSRRTSLLTRRLRVVCPESGEEVTASLIEDTRTGRFVSVEGCDGALAQTCAKSCLERQNEQRIRLRGEA